MIYIVDENDTGAINYYEALIASSDTIMFDKFYEYLRIVIALLYVVCLEVKDEIADYFNGEIILYLPSGLAWKLCDVDGNIQDFTLPEKHFKSLKITFHGKIWYFTFDMPFLHWWDVIIPALENLSIPGSEEFYYYRYGEYQQGLDFTPVETLKMTDVSKDILLFSIVSLVITALVKVGHHVIATKLAAKALTVGQSSVKATFEENVTDNLDTMAEEAAERHATLLEQLQQIAAIAGQADDILTAVQELNTMFSLLSTTMNNELKPYILRIINSIGARLKF